MTGQTENKPKFAVSTFAKKEQKPLFDPKNPIVIHRDANSIVLAGHGKMYKTQRINGEGPKWGYKAEANKPYCPVGTLANVIPIVEDLKALTVNAREPIAADV